MFQEAGEPNPCRPHPDSRELSLLVSAAADPPTRGTSGKPAGICPNRSTGTQVTVLAERHRLVPHLYLALKNSGVGPGSTGRVAENPPTISSQCHAQRPIHDRNWCALPVPWSRRAFRQCPSKARRSHSSCTGAWSAGNSRIWISSFHQTRPFTQPKSSERWDTTARELPCRS